MRMIKPGGLRNSALYRIQFVRTKQVNELRTTLTTARYHTIRKKHLEIDKHTDTYNIKTPINLTTYFLAYGCCSSIGGCVCIFDEWQIAQEKQVVF